VGKTLDNFDVDFNKKMNRQRDVRPARGTRGRDARASVITENRPLKIT
jgi:hypothetical protein